MEPDRDIDLEEDISAIKSSVRPGGQSYESEESSEEEEEREGEAHERLMRAKVSRGDSPSTETSKRQTRASSGTGEEGGEGQRKGEGRDRGRPGGKESIAVNLYVQ